MHRILALIILAIFITNSLSAQKGTKERYTDPASLVSRINQLDALPYKKIKTNSTDRTRYVTPYIFDSIIYKYQQSISGIAVKDGKVIGTSLTIDDQSATFNWVPFKKNKETKKQKIITQITFQGESDDGIVDLISSGNYQNRISAGVQLHYFTKRTTGSFYSSNKTLLHNKLKAYATYFKSMRQSEIEKAVASNYDSLKSSFEKGGYLKYKVTAIDKIKDSSKMYLYLKKYTNLLVALDIDDEEWTETNYSAIKEKIDQIDINEQKRNLIALERLKVADSIQMSAQWNKFRIFWLGSSLKYNNTRYPLLDPVDSLSLYTRDFTDQAFTFDVSFNWLWDNSRRKIRMFTYPTLRIDNNLSFDEKDLINIQKNNSYVVGTDTIIAYKQSSFYPSKPDRKLRLGLEIPYIQYYTEKNIGWETGIECWLTPKLEKLNFRFGVYLPLTIGESTGLIEPLFRIKEIEQGGKFWKEMFSIGLNISVSLPKFIASFEKE